jgi:hypothetical protein
MIDSTALWADEGLSIFERLGIPDAPQTQKRAMLARRAIELGLVSLRELR